MRFYSPEGFLHLNILYSSVALQAEIVNEESINQSINQSIKFIVVEGMNVCTHIMPICLQRCSKDPRASNNLRGGDKSACSYVSGKHAH